MYSTMKPHANGRATGEGGEMTRSKGKRIRAALRLGADYLLPEFERLRAAGWPPTDATRDAFLGRLHTAREYWRGRDLGRAEQIERARAAFCQALLLRQEGK
jgi:hypothetical protein